MKTRIIEEINSNGSSTFYPQRKMLFWWWKFEDHFGMLCELFLSPQSPSMARFRASIGD
jgi:hypothetical protein